MNQFFEFFTKLLDTSDWPPRWHCGKWSEFHGWLYIISDLLIWSAYFAIPLIIIKYISQKKDTRFYKIYFLFAAFILACGATHFLDAIAFWIPVYRLNALVRFITGTISWITVFFLIKMLPYAFSLKSPRELEKEVEHRSRIEGELRKSNAQLNEAQDLAKLGYWEWDIKSNIVYWSEGLFKIFNLPKTDRNLSYESFLVNVHPEDRAFVEAFIHDAFRNKTFKEYYHRILCDNGELKTIHARGEVILNDDNEIIKMIGTSQDVTEQKKNELELLLRSRELEAVNNELQKFAYVASHDLQEPLRKIITFTSILEKNYSDNMGDSGRIYMKKIINSTERMQNLINDILNFSKLAGKESSFEKTNLKAVIQQVISDMEVIIERTGAKIKIGEMHEIEANKSQMGQLFQNLISNAIKFSKQSEPASIQIYSEIIRGSNVPAEYIKNVHFKFSVLDNPKYLENELFCKIYVSDEGIGFDELYLDRLFIIFQRLHNKSTYEGTGIGLAICKKIVENHNGIITAKSVIEKGSTFIIILPISQTNYG